MSTVFNGINHILMSATSPVGETSDLLADMESTVSEVKDVVTAVTTGSDQAGAEVNNLLTSFYNKILELGSNLLAGVIVAVIGWYIVKFLSKGCSKLLHRSKKIDESVASFLSSLIGMGLKIILAVTVVATLGVEMSSITALVASAGLAISLSLQGCLSNFSGGVLILVLKPFTVGDYIIDSNGNEGSVTAIDIIYTKLLTADNKAVVVPNGALANATVTNVTKEPLRRIDFNVSIDYSEDVDKVKKILVDLANEHPLVLKDQEIKAMVNKFDPSAIDMILRVWVNTEDYWDLKWEMQALIKLTFDKNNIVIPYDKLDVNIVEPVKEETK